MLKEKIFCKQNFDINVRRDVAPNDKDNDNKIS